MFKSCSGHRYLRKYEVYDLKPVSNSLRGPRDHYWIIKVAMIPFNDNPRFFKAAKHGNNARIYLY
jgi:hypothetical protein